MLIGYVQEIKYLLWHSSIATKTIPVDWSITIDQMTWSSLNSDILSGNGDRIKRADVCERKCRQTSKGDNGIWLETLEIDTLVGRCVNVLQDNIGACSYSRSD